MRTKIDIELINLTSLNCSQGECGACWSFSALSVLEYWSARAGRFDIFSEQNLIDCDTKSSGCDGGWPTG